MTKANRYEKRGCNVCFFCVPIDYITESSALQSNTRIHNSPRTAQVNAMLIFSFRTSSLIILRFLLLSQVKCDIRAKYNTHPDNKWTNTVTSPLFFAGIEVRQSQLQISTVM